MILLPGLIAPKREMYAVFTDDAGEPVFEPVVAYGIFEVDEVDQERGRRLVAAFSQGEHIESADFKPNFVSLTSPSFGEAPSADDWRERCKAKRVEIEEEKARQKIVIPNAGQVQGVFGNN